MPPRAARWPYLVLAVEVLIFFRHVLFYGGYSIPWDLPFYHQPLAWFASRSLARGELPLWDPFTYAGMPIYANLTTQVFYPPTLITLVLSNWIGNGAHLLDFLEWQIAAHVFAAGAFTYWMLRRLGSGIAASLVGATAYQLGAYFASQTQHLGAINAAAWMPLAWLAVWELRHRFRWPWMAGLAAALSLSFLAGFPAATAVVYASTILLALVLSSWRAVAACAVAFAWSALVSAIQLFPTMELSGQSVAALRSEWMESAGGVQPAALITLLAPDWFGVLEFTPSTWKLPSNPTFLYLYCGLAAVVFAVFALIRGRGLPFAALLVLSALWMLGGNTPVYREIFSILPDPVKAPLYCEFAMCAFTLALALLGGLGAHQLLRARPRWVHIAVVAVAAADLIAFSSGRPMNTADLAGEPGVGYDHFDSYREIPARLRQLVNQNQPPWRIDTMQGSMNWAGCANLFEVPTAGGNDPFALLRYMQVRLSFTGGERWGRYYQVRDPDSPILKLLNVRYLLSNAPLKEPGALVKIEELPGNRVYEVSGPLPRFFFAKRLRRASHMDEALRILRSPEFDVGAEAVIEGAGALPAGGDGTVRTVRYSPREVVLETETAAPAFLVTSETWYPGWHATLDGIGHRLVLTNVAFRGIPVPAGRHTITMRFDPPILARSAFASAAGIAMVVVALAVGDNKRNRA
jgi:hypothetical protein